MPSSRYLIAVVLASLLAVSVGGVAVGKSAVPPSLEPRPGRADFIEMGCYQCHGYEGQGARATGPRIAPDPLPYEAFSEWVRRPPDVMPAYSPKVLSDEKLERIYEYLQSIPEPPEVSSLPAFSEK